MSQSPLEDQSYSATGQLSAECLQSFDLEQGLVLAVDRLEVGRLMVVVEHADHYPEEPVDLRHRRLTPEISLSPGACELELREAWDVRARTPCHFPLPRCSYQDCNARPGTGQLLVGHIAFPSGSQLRIQSRKASARSLFAWMAFADPSLGALKELGRVSDSVATGDLSSVASRLFCTELLRVASRHGLRRSYHRVRNEGATIRGRIDFNRLNRLGGNASRVPCVAWERLPSRLWPSGGM